MEMPGLEPVTGDVLVPVLITFLVVNVVLLVRAWANGQIRRPHAAAAVRSPHVPLAAGSAAPDPTDEGVAVAPAAPDRADEGVAVAPAAPDPADEGVAVAPAAPDPAEVRPPPVTGVRDVLPGLDDEATWDRRVADENARLVRYRRPVTIVRLELDGLDRLVGLLGEEAGDRLLRATADTLRRLARDTDHVAYLGAGGSASSCRRRRRRRPSCMSIASIERARCGSSPARRGPAGHRLGGDLWTDRSCCRGTTRVRARASGPLASHPAGHPARGQSSWSGTGGSRDRQPAGHRPVVGCRPSAVVGDLPRPALQPQGRPSTGPRCPLKGLPRGPGTVCRPPPGGAPGTARARHGPPRRRSADGPRSHGGPRS